LGIVARSAGDLWDKVWNKNDQADRTRKYVNSKFEKHVMSEQGLVTALDETLAHMQSDVTANRNRLHIQVRPLVEKKKLELGYDDIDTEAFASQIQTRSRDFLKASARDTVISGTALGRKLSTEELMIVARHSDDMAALPKDQWKKVLEAVLNNTKAVLTYLEKHPRILYTAAGVATVISLREDLIGSAEKVSIDKNGNKSIYRPGLVDRLLKMFKDEITYIVYAIAALVLLWGLIHLHSVYALNKVKRQVKKLELEKKIAKTSAEV